MFKSDRIQRVFRKCYGFHRTSTNSEFQLRIRIPAFMPQTRIRRSYLKKVIVHYAHAGKQIWIWGWLRQRLTHSFLQMISSLMKFWGTLDQSSVVITDDGILSSKYGIDTSPRDNNLNERKTKTISHNGKFLGDLSCGRIHLPPVLEEVLPSNEPSKFRMW